MKHTILFLVLILYGCTTIPKENTLFSWLDTDPKRTEQWLNKQHQKYNLYKEEYLNTIDSITKTVKQDTGSPNSSFRKKIGDYLFYINDIGIYYKTIDSKTYSLFKHLDSLSFQPKFISTNYSKHLIIKGSKNFNDKCNVQVWDIGNKILLKDFNTQNYPEIQATKNNLYFSTINTKEKVYIKRYNFLDKKVHQTNIKSVFSFKIIDTSKILTTIGKKFYIASDDTDNTPYFLFENKDRLEFIGYNTDVFFFYKKDKTETTFYEYNKKEQQLKTIYTLKKERSLNQCILHNGKLYFSFIEKGKNNVSSIDISTHALHTILSNRLGTLTLINNYKNNLTVIYSSFKTPEIVYKLDNNGVLNIVSETKNKQTQYYNVKQEWVINKKDSIPLILYYKNNLDKSNSPLIMYGYGGFGRSIMPKYSSFINTFVEHGGIYAIAGIRGGGEMGIDWHKKAIKNGKKQSFNDFKACLDFVIKNKISNPDNIAILGASNGGLLINHAILNYSNKFKVAISMKGLSDMINFPKYNNGSYWINEYGNPKKNAMYNYLKNYSPLHNLKKIDNKTTKVLVITGNKDDRVSPIHPYKYVFGLQNQGNESVYLKTIKNVGHQLPKKKENELYSEIYGFIYHNIEEFN